MSLNYEADQHPSCLNFLCTRWQSHPLARCLPFQREDFIQQMTEQIAPLPSQWRTGGHSNQNAGGNRIARPSFANWSRPFSCGQTAHYQRKRPATFLTLLGTLKVNQPITLALPFVTGLYRWLKNWGSVLVRLTPWQVFNPPSRKRLIWSIVCPNTVREVTEDLGQVVVEEERAAIGTGGTWLFLNCLPHLRRPRNVERWCGPKRIWKTCSAAVPTNQFAGGPRSVRASALAGKVSTRSDPMERGLRRSGMGRTGFSMSGELLGCLGVGEASGPGMGGEAPG